MKPASGERWKRIRKKLLPALDRVETSLHRRSDDLKKVRQLARLAEKDPERCQQHLHVGVLWSIVGSVLEGPPEPQATDALIDLIEVLKSEGIYTHSIHAAGSALRMARILNAKRRRSGKDRSG
jgi:hypothetical protein